RRHRHRRVSRRRRRALSTRHARTDPRALGRRARRQRRRARAHLRRRRVGRSARAAPRTPAPRADRRPARRRRPPQPRLRRNADPLGWKASHPEIAMTFLEQIAARLDAGERLGFADGVALWHEPNLALLGALANRERERRHGARTFFNVNMHLNATNVCVADCKFCSFARLEEGMPGAYTMTLDEALDKVRARPADLTEIHIVNGLHPTLPFSYYE